MEPTDLFFVGVVRPTHVLGESNHAFQHGAVRPLAERKYVETAAHISEGLPLTSQHNSVATYWEESPSSAKAQRFGRPKYGPLNARMQLTRSLLWPRATANQ